jgi:hypothetical protein
MPAMLQSIRPSASASVWTARRKGLCGHTDAGVLDFDLRAAAGQQLARDERLGVRRGECRVLQQVCDEVNDVVHCLAVDVRGYQSARLHTLVLLDLIGGGPEGIHGARAGNETEPVIP